MRWCLAACISACMVVALAGAPPERFGRTAALELRRGERYCRVKGTPGFVLGRNPTETSPEAFDERFAEMAAAGESLARLHLMHGMSPNAEAGRVDEPWAARWDRVFEAAERRGIGVIPVFTVWAQWNDGTGGELWHVWHDNPYNTVRGGPAKSPAEILSDTECRRVWLEWLGALVKRWQLRAGIIAWEPISELDLVTGATPAAGAAFIESAARVIRLSPYTALSTSLVTRAYAVCSVAVQSLSKVDHFSSVGTSGSPSRATSRAGMPKLADSRSLSTYPCTSAAMGSL